MLLNIKFQGNSERHGIKNWNLGGGLQRKKSPQRRREISNFRTVYPLENFPWFILHVCAAHNTFTLLDNIPATAGPQIMTTIEPQISVAK